MATPAQIGIYYASKFAVENGSVAEYFVGTVNNAISFTVNNISEATDAWNGALGYFINTTTADLRGVTFHVRKWTKETNTHHCWTGIPR
jgi:hypothetical protein